MILSGVRVVELTADIGAAFCARLLADLGAEVVKVEPDTGDPLRGDTAGHSGAEAALFAYLNHGKRSVTLDPGSPRGAALFGDLVASSAVLVESEISLDRSGRLPDIAGTRERTPSLVVVSVTPYGLSPPPDDVPSSPLTLQHQSSYAGHQARPVSDPATQPPVGCTDREGPLAIGVGAAVSALYGLLVVGNGGRGPHIDMASLDFYAAHLSPDPLAEWCAGERLYDRHRSNFAGTEVAGGLLWMLKCRDGWILVSPREQHQWARWVGLLGHPAWAQDASLCGTREARRTHYGPLQELMSEALADRDKQPIFEAARREGIACFPVSEAADLLANAQLQHRSFFDSLKLASGASVPVPGLPFKLQEAGGELPRGRDVHAPRLGEGNADILGILAAAALAEQHL